MEDTKNEFVIVRVESLVKRDLLHQADIEGMSLSQLLRSIMEDYLNEKN